MNCLLLVHRNWYMKSKHLLAIMDHKLPVFLSHSVHPVDLTGKCLLMDRETGKNAMWKICLWHLETMSQHLSFRWWPHVFCLKIFFYEENASLQIISVLEKVRIFFSLWYLHLIFLKEHNNNNNSNSHLPWGIQTQINTCSSKILWVVALAKSIPAHERNSWKNTLPPWSTGKQKLDASKDNADTKHQRKTCVAPYMSVA